MSLNACANSIEVKDIKQQGEEQKLNEEIVVDVTGEVKNKGIIRLKQGARLCDAIKKAGGITTDADLASVNQAKLLKDGEHILIPKKMSQDADKRININTATQQELQKIRGIGESRAKEIIEYRNKNGVFSSIYDLKAIKGIKETFIKKIEDSIKVQ